MKKMNKKGFTLAELLIVLAILAILIAIAIPVFSAQLENAKRQADHANLRSAYAVVQTANILGYKSIDGFTGDDTDANFIGAIYCTDGTFKKSGGTAVKIQTASHGADKTGCQECVVPHYNATSGTFTVDKGIVITKTGSTYGLGPQA